MSEDNKEQKKGGGGNIVIGGKTGKLDSHSLAVLRKFDWKGCEVNDSNMKRSVLTVNPGGVIRRCRAPLIGSSSLCDKNFHQVCLTFTWIPFHT